MRPIGISLLSGWWFLNHPDHVFPMVANSHKSQNFKMTKTMVGFGRTELSLSLSCTEFRALSHGHGFRGPCFNGVRKSWVLHDLLDRFFIEFGRFLTVVPGSFWNAKIRKSWKSVLTIPKDVGGLGDLGKRVFGPKFPKFKGKNSDFRFRVWFLLRATHLN